MEDRLFILRSVYQKILARKLVIDDETDDVEEDINLEDVLE